MSVPDERPLPCGGGRVLMLGTVMLAAVAAAVLAVGAQDAHLLRLGLVAALWAALLGAFAAARMRREISSDASRSDELRTVYQLELEREVAARREHTLTVERELREQTEQVERREIAALRAELAAIRASLEKLVGENPLGERAEPARLVPMPARPRKFDDSPSIAAALGASAKAPCSRTAAVPTLPTSEWPVNGRSETALTPREDPEFHFGPGRRYRPELDTHARPPAHSNGSHSNGSHSNGSHSNGSHSNGSHSNGSHSNGGGARRAAQEPPAVGTQRSVNDLLAAHGADSPPRRRRSRDDGPQAATGA